MYKTTALPTRILDDKFVKHVFDYPYFSLDKNQHDYILLLEADLLCCKTSSITICPADVTIYCASAITCKASLFHQRTDSHNLCQRSRLLHHKAPTLQRHGTIWLYQFPEPKQAVIHCLGIEDTPHRDTHRYETHTERFSVFHFHQPYQNVSRPPRDNRDGTAPLAFLHTR